VIDSYGTTTYLPQLPFRSRDGTRFGAKRNETKHVAIRHEPANSENIPSTSTKRKTIATETSHGTSIGAKRDETRRDNRSYRSRNRLRIHVANDSFIPSFFHSFIPFVRSIDRFDRSISQSVSDPPSVDCVVLNTSDRYESETDPTKQSRRNDSTGLDWTRLNWTGLDWTRLDSTPMQH